MYQVHSLCIIFIPEEGIEKRDREGLDGRFGGHWSAVCVGVRFVSLPSAKAQAGMQAGGREHDAASMAMGARLRERGEDSMVTNIFGN